MECLGNHDMNLKRARGRRAPAVLGFVMRYQCESESDFGFDMPAENLVKTSNRNFELYRHAVVLNV